MRGGVRLYQYAGHTGDVYMCRESMMVLFVHAQTV